MHTQKDLFAVKDTISPQEVFPDFRVVEDDNGYYSTIKHTEMISVLVSLGFNVKSQSYYSGEILVFPVGEYTHEWNLFNVDYPQGWILTDDLSTTVYTGDCNPVRQILDHNGNLRGIVHCSLSGIPESAKLYTRYSVISGVHLNFSKTDFEKRGVRSVVIDYTTIDPECPNFLSSPLHIDRRWLLGEMYPSLQNVPNDERMKWCEENVQQEDNLFTMRNSGSSLWLDEYFPDWRNPAAYWPE